tara:strand:- start:190 stop:552 length:363 start_codon:yes stop_codon:yes gene_type:complete
MRKNSTKKVDLPEFIRLSHYRIQIIQINSHISYELAEQQGSFHSREMKIYVDETIIEKGGTIACDLLKHEIMHAIFYIRSMEDKKEEDIVNGMATHYTEVEKNNPDYVRWKIANLHDGNI